MHRAWRLTREGSVYVLHEELLYTPELGWGREELRWFRQPRYRGWRSPYHLDKLHPGSLFVAHTIMYRCFGSLQLADYYANALRWKYILFQVGRHDFTLLEGSVRTWIDREWSQRDVFGAQNFSTQ